MKLSAEDLKLIRTDSENKDFHELVILLDRDLKIRDGSEHSFFAQYNKIDSIKYVVVAYIHNKPVGCGAIKHYSESTMEVKRMFVAPDKRGNGLASAILRELEDWSRELNYKKCILETGLRQPEAISLYKKNKYIITPNYGPYKTVTSSVCFEKDLI
jgi:putative acetyltransferase